MVHDLVDLRLGHHDTHGGPLLVVQWGNCGAFESRRDRDGCRDLLDRDIEVHQHIPLGGEHTLQAARQADEPLVLGVQARGTDQHRFGMHNRVGEDAKARITQRGAGRHHIGDEVGHAKLHRGLHRTIQMDRLGFDALLHEIVVH